jgi:hypothetical protein
LARLASALRDQVFTELTILKSQLTLNLTNPSAAAYLL